MKMWLEGLTLISLLGVFALGATAQSPVVVERVTLAGPQTTSGLDNEVESVLMRVDGDGRLIVFGAVTVPTKLVLDYFFACKYAESQTLVDARNLIIPTTGSAALRQRALEVERCEIAEEKLERAAGIRVNDFSCGRSTGLQPTVATVNDLTTCTR